MSFRIGDTLIYFDSAVTSQERSVLTPGKNNLTTQLVICNPKIAACQRKCGLDPTTDTTVFGNAGYNIIPFGEAKLSDIFDTCDTLDNCLIAERGFSIGKGSDVSYSKSQSNYGNYIRPGSIPSMNNTSVHYSLSASIGSLSDSRYTTSYSKSLSIGLGGSTPHAFKSGRTCTTRNYDESCTVMIVI